ncbi:hypothetical protein DFQ29_004086 [Apophysomyces sp. BC1021]|nr:hypothetical protein DFQ29_004086 [Apophysomyces sp. BC1021]
MEQTPEPQTGSNYWPPSVESNLLENNNGRRKSESNIHSPPLSRQDTQDTSSVRGRRRTSHLDAMAYTHRDVAFKSSLSSIMSQRQHLRQLKHTQINPAKLSQSQTQEDTFYQTVEIRLHHSVGSMSISPTCRDVVLAGRQGLVIIDLEDPWLLPRMLPHLSKWEVADVQWSPYVSRESWVASTSNQRLLVWNLNYPGSQAIEHVLHAHSRAISDINWSPHHPDLLATCSVDTYVHLWDLRCAGQSQDADDGKYMRPVNSFTPWNAATTQVKFNRKSEFLLASAHDKDVKIWDIRKGAVPITSITAHSKKIYGIDWSRQNDHDIVTCSLDKLVKFWNIHTPDNAEEVIVTNTPVWRARNTPFGNGVLTMPQRSESTLFLYNRASPDIPVHAFEGHTDTVKEFVWRWKGSNGDGGDNREFQLVTWSKDQNLRLWPVPEEIMKSVGHDPSGNKSYYSSPVNALKSDGSYRTHSFQQALSQKQFTDEQPCISAPVTPLRLTPSSHISTMTPFRSAAPTSGTVGFSSGYDVMSNTYREQKYSINPLLWMQNVKTVGPASELRRDATTENTYQTVADEMSVVLNKYANAGVKTEKVNGASRTCTISLHGPWSDTGVAFLRITIQFSPQYPDNSPPEFEIQKNSMMSIYYRAHMAQDLNALASSYTSQKRWCLEPCIRYLLGETASEDTEFGRGHGPINAEQSAGLPLQNSNNGSATSLTSSPGQSGYVGNWNSGNAVDNGDSDDEIFTGPTFVGGIGGYGMGKRVSLQSEKGIVVDMSSKQSADEKVPFPRLCGGVFSGNVRDSKRSNNTVSKNENEQDTTPTSNASNGEYFENTYSDFYKHPRTYEQFEEYKEIAAMSRRGRNATVLVGGSGGAFGEYAYDDDPDDIDDGLTNMASLYFKTDSLAMGGSIGNSDSLLYRSAKTDRITYNVVIADFSEMIPCSPWLAKEYILSPDDPVSACIHNAEACKEHGRFDLYRVWSLALEVLRECVPIDVPGQPRVMAEDANQPFKRDTKLAELRKLLDANQRGQPHVKTLQNETKSVVSGSKRQRVKWGLHPFGQKLAHNLLQHFIHIGDIQTAAMLSCIFRDTHLPLHKATPKRKTTMSAVVPEVTVLDYFTPELQHRLEPPDEHSPVRAPGGTNAANSPERASLSQLSSSYGTKGVNFLSYFWDSDRQTPPPVSPEKVSCVKHPEPDDPIVVASSQQVSRLYQLWHPSLRLPSNTAPGIRRASSSTESQVSLTSLPAVVTSCNAVVSNKEGKVLPADETTIEFTNMEYFDGERLFQFNDVPLLEPKDAAQRDVLRLVYADMLYRWGLLEQRAEVLKYNTKQVFPAVEKHMQVQIRCYVCNAEIANRDNICYTCRKLRRQIQCSICHVLVKGAVNFCIKCGHGGHSAHMKDWFVHAEQTVCPTGCGCYCLFETVEFGTTCR